MRVKCRIGDNEDFWEEELEVKSLESAESDIRNIVKSFNDSLRPGEKLRHFIELVTNEKESR